MKHTDLLTNKMERMKNGGARIIFALMVNDCYSIIKLAADSLGIITQCVKWKNVTSPSRGLYSNILMKENAKLGGTNHTLLERAPWNGEKVFQEPPNSLSWVLDEKCMFIGVDVSHADQGSSHPSHAAVVGSLDGRCSQYVTHLSTQKGRTEMVYEMEDAMESIIRAFKAKNGDIPRHIIVYRDGVSDSQFQTILDNELPAIKGALARLGYPEDAALVTIIICQKNHHTRLVYEEKVGEKQSYINPSPGLCVDASSGSDSISSPDRFEFYLNSHATIQGTAKPTKYSVIYDEIGFKLSEIQLMTYWLCYLYARCTKSVSVATPAYYAHWYLYT